MRATARRKVEGARVGPSLLTAINHGNVREGAAVAMMMIGAANRAERPLDNRRGRALRVQHVDEHMIIKDVERVRRDLGRNMPIADVPGERQEVETRLSPAPPRPFRSMREPR